MTRTQALAFHNFNQFIGLDSLARELDRMTASHVTERYPPHNILKTDENKYLVELATAGFSQDDLSVVVEDKVLKITGSQSLDVDGEYLQKGISTKAFEKCIPLIDTVIVRGAEYVNGILRISLENVIPEERMPKKIPIMGMNQEQKLLID